MAIVEFKNVSRIYTSGDHELKALDNVNLTLAGEYEMTMVLGWKTYVISVAFAFGCPSMGAEQLEESEFEPMFSSVEDKLSGKNIALFGSYGWGDGQWMRDWEERCVSAGAKLVCVSVICNSTPDDEATVNCNALGAALA